MADEVDVPGKVPARHCAAFHDTNTVARRKITEHTGMTNGLEATGQVFRTSGQHRGSEGHDDAPRASKALAILSRDTA